MSYWEIGYLVFAVITWFLMFGLVIKMKQRTDTAGVVLVALLVIATPLALTWPLTLTLSVMASIGKREPEAEK